MQYSSAAGFTDLQPAALFMLILAFLTEAPIACQWAPSHWGAAQAAPESQELLCFHQCWRLYVCNLVDSVQQQECSLLSGKNIEIFQQKQNNYTMMGPVNRSNWNRVFKENGLWGGFKGIVVDFSFEGFVVDFEEIVQYYYCGTLSVGGLLRSLLGKTICTWATPVPLPFTDKFVNFDRIFTKCRFCLFLFPRI